MKCCALHDQLFGDLLASGQPSHKWLGTELSAVSDTGHVQALSHNPTHPAVT